MPPLPASPSRPMKLCIISISAQERAITHDQGCDYTPFAATAQNPGCELPATKTRGAGESPAHPPGPKRTATPPRVRLSKKSQNQETMQSKRAGGNVIIKRKERHWIDKQRRGWILFQGESWKLKKGEQQTMSQGPV
mmetsp:Transcript_11608/g.25444  ORF Transcript_11608/g.25444 Transcript_11608/m.25444 type:complete len:137 (-) Transcript_11608:104-514(-)